MTGWPEVKVSDLVRDRLLVVGDGYRVRNAELGSVGVPFVRGGDIGENGEVNTEVSDRIAAFNSPQIVAKTSQPGDVIFITKGTVGRVGFLRETQPRVVVAPQVAVWRSLDHSKLAPRFVYYLLRGNRFQSQLDGVKTHGSMAADYVSISDQMSFRLPLPPVRHQHQIAQILGALDDRSDLNRRMNQTLEAQAQALFKSWFVDFEPVTKRKAGDGGASWGDAVLSLFPATTEESELGAVPQGWEVVELGALAEVEKGLSYKGEFLTEHGTPMVNLKCIKAGGGFNPKGMKPYSGGFKTRHRVDGGEVVVANTDLTQAREVIGAPALLPRSLADVAIFSHHIYALRRRDKSKISSEFLYQLLMTETYRSRAASFATGTTVLGLPQDAVLGFKFALPAMALMDRYSAVAKTICSRIEHNNEEVRTLVDLRDSLLPKLLSGEMHVRDAELQAAAFA